MLLFPYPLATKCVLATVVHRRRWLHLLEAHSEHSLCTSPTSRCLTPHAGFRNSTRETPCRFLTLVAISNMRLTKTRTSEVRSVYPIHDPNILPFFLLKIYRKVSSISLNLELSNLMPFYDFTFNVPLIVSYSCDTGAPALRASASKLHHEALHPLHLSGLTQHIGRRGSTTSVLAAGQGGTWVNPSHLLFNTSSFSLILRKPVWRIRLQPIVHRREKPLPVLWRP